MHSGVAGTPCAVTGRGDPLILGYQKSGATPTGYHAMQRTSERPNGMEIQVHFFCVWLLMSRSF
jgi:hypothetical protein